MQITLLEQVLADGFAGAALEQNVIRHDNGRPPIDFQHFDDVLDKVQPFVTGGCPEIIALDDGSSRTGGRCYPRFSSRAGLCDAGDPTGRNRAVCRFRRYNHRRGAGIRRCQPPGRRWYRQGAGA